ncbi:MAG TPA: GAF domain-containing protein, partial [Candidatus Dormibacteraeota bacterium]|nr:GAF domain-containing protein [Candidatus Dormibacteraeota bacterium]
MKIAPLPQNEPERLAALRRYHVLDTAPEPAFDDLTRLAAHICGTPVSLITLLDEKRQWFKSRFGLDLKESPREYSFCSHSILGQDVFVVEDARQAEGFADNPVVAGGPGIRFYAGMPLITPDGFALGTMCVMDREPRRLEPEQM